MNRRSFNLFLLSTALVGAGSWLSGGFGRLAGASAIPGAAMAQETKPADPATTIRPDFTLGSPDAKVTLMEYGSYTCPHCRDFHDEVFGKIKANYIDTGKVKFIFREVYFDKFGLWAGMIAQCAGDMRYYGVNDMLYSEQRDWIGSGKAEEIADNLRKIGAKAGMSKEQVDACLNDQAMAQSMVATYQKHATEDGVDSTPTFFINGTKHSNMGYDEMAKLLDAALAG